MLTEETSKINQHDKYLYNESGKSAMIADETSLSCIYTLLLHAAPDSRLRVCIGNSSTAIKKKNRVQVPYVCAK